MHTRLCDGSVVRMKPVNVWALVDPRGKVRGGDYKCAIYWTRAMAKLEQQDFPECQVVRVVVKQKSA